MIRGAFARLINEKGRIHHLYPVCGWSIKKASREGLRGVPIRIDSQRPRFLMPTSPLIVLALPPASFAVGVEVHTAGTQRKGSTSYRP